MRVMAALTEGSAPIVVFGMVLTFLGTCVTGYFAVKSHAQAKQANFAVNHQDEQPPGTPRIYDAVLDLYGRKYATEAMLVEMDGRSVGRDVAIKRTIQDHIDDEAPKVQAISIALATLETKKEAVARTSDMETRSLADERTEVIVEAVHEASKP